MALAYTAPTWTDGSGEGISASNLQAISDNLEGLVQGTDKAVHSISIDGSVITFTYADGTEETATAVNLKGIVSITKTGTVGLVDTYTITYTDGTTSTFTVTNGQSSSGDMLAADYDPTEAVKTAGGIPDYVTGRLPKYIELSPSSSTTYTFLDADITADSRIDVYTDTFGDNPSNVVASAGSCTVTFAAAQTRTVGIEIH